MSTDITKPAHAVISNGKHCQVLRDITLDGTFCRTPPTFSPRASWNGTLIISTTDRDLALSARYAATSIPTKLLGIHVHIIYQLL